MKNVSLLVVLAGLLSIAVWGCATIVSGTKQDITITSNPANASLEIKTTTGMQVFSGTTPATVALKTKNEYLVTIRLDGYLDETVSISHAFNSWVIGNLLFGGIPGLIIDYISGAMHKLEPGMVSINLGLAINIESGESDMYAVLSAMDTDGKLRHKIIKLVQKSD